MLHLQYYEHLQPLKTLMLLLQLWVEVTFIFAKGNQSGVSWNPVNRIKS